VDISSVIADQTLNQQLDGTFSTNSLVGNSVVICDNSLRFNLTNGIRELKHLWFEDIDFRNFFWSRRLYNFIRSYRITLVGYYVIRIRFKNELNYCGTGAIRSYYNIEISEINDINEWRFLNQLPDAAFFFTFNNVIQSTPQNEDLLSKNVVDFIGRILFAFDLIPVLRPSIVNIHSFCGVEGPAVVTYKVGTEISQDVKIAKSITDEWSITRNLGFEAEAIPGITIMNGLSFTYTRTEMETIETQYKTATSSETTFETTIQLNKTDTITVKQILLIDATKTIYSKVIFDQSEGCSN
jgi:hypothetical protein